MIEGPTVSTEIFCKVSTRLLGPGGEVRRDDARPRRGDQKTRRHTPEQQQQRQATFPRDAADSRIDRVDQSTQSIAESIGSLLSLLLPLLLSLLLSLLLLRLPLLLPMPLHWVTLARAGT